MAFTFTDGVQNLAFFFISLYMHPIQFDGETLLAVNIYANQTTNFCYYLVSLQSWIFGMRYLESAMFSSLTPACVAYQKVKYINWAGIFIYALSMLALYIWCLVTFPGYVNGGSLD
jgi:hypothetical protein